MTENSIQHTELIWIVTKQLIFQKGFLFESQASGTVSENYYLTNLHIWQWFPSHKSVANIKKNCESGIWEESVWKKQKRMKWNA